MDNPTLDKNGTIRILNRNIQSFMKYSDLINNRNNSSKSFLDGLIAIFDLNNYFNREPMQIDATEPNRDISVYFSALDKYISKATKQIDAEINEKSKLPPNKTGSNPANNIG